MTSSGSLGSGSTGWRVPRAAARSAALVAMLAAGGITAGAASASGQRPAQVRVAYTCRFPSGPVRTEVGISAALPAAATAGQPIQPTGAKLALTIPAAGLRDLARRHLTVVTAGAWLTLQVSLASTPSTSQWSR